MFATLLSGMRNHPLTVRFAALLLVILGCGCGFRYWLSEGNTPAASIVLQSPDSTSRIRIARTEHGVPHIEAETDDDAFFAIGYVHAQDRLWQLELQRRTIHGELSELLGK